MGEERGSGIGPARLPEQPVGLFYTWWTGDDLPALGRPDQLIIEHDPPAGAIRAVVDLSDEQIDRRRAEGNRALVARIGDTPAGIGWAAAGRVEIGELGLEFRLPPGNRYLWDFVTLAEWRGRGIYPALLQAFIRAGSDVERFWVGHDLDNTPSARGILRAGFRQVGEVYAVPEGIVYASRQGGDRTRARVAVELLGIPSVGLDE